MLVMKMDGFMWPPTVNPMNTMRDKSQNCEIVNLILCPCGLILILSCLFL